MFCVCGICPESYCGILCHLSLACVGCGNRVLFIMLMLSAGSALLDSQYSEAPIREESFCVFVSFTLSP